MLLAFLIYYSRCLENPASGHSMFLNRQFWNCFKLFKNILYWHGLVADKVLIEMAFHSLLNRYLLIGLRVNPVPNDSALKSRQIVNTIPSAWRKGKSRVELQRFIDFVSSLGTSTGLSRDAVRNIVNQLKDLSAYEDSEKLEKTVLLA